MSIAERMTCPVCNGHGYTVLVEDMDYGYTRNGELKVVVLGSTRRAPTDEEAERDLSDLSPAQCSNKCFLGTITKGNLP